MSNYSLGVIGIGILSVGVVGISLKVAFTTLKPHFNQSFERLEFANGTLYTQAEHNAELLSKLGKEIGRVQDKIALLMNQLEDVRSSVDLADSAVPSSSASSTPRRRRSRIGPFARPESDEEVGIESASEGESDDEPEEEADRRQAGPTTVLEGGEEIPVISASTSSASYSPPEDLPLPLVTSTATATASSSRPDRSKIVSRTLSSSSLIPQTNHADRIFRSMQKSSEQCRAATQRRHEDFEMRQAQKTSSALTTLNQGSSLSAPGLMDTLKTRTAMAATSLAAAAGAGAGGSSTGQVGLVNNQYYSLIHIQTPSSVPDFLNFGKYFSSIVRTGIFSAIYSVIV